MSVPFMTHRSVPFMPESIEEISVGAITLDCINRMATNMPRLQKLETDPVNVTGFRGEEGEDGER